MSVVLQFRSAVGHMVKVLRAAHDVLKAGRYFIVQPAIVTFLSPLLSGESSNRPSQLKHATHTSHSEPAVSFLLDNSNFTGASDMRTQTPNSRDCGPDRLTALGTGAGHVSAVSLGDPPLHAQLDNPVSGCQLLYACEVAAHLRVSVFTVRRWTKSGAFRSCARRVGGRLRYTPEALRGPKQD